MRFKEMSYTDSSKSQLIGNSMYFDIAYRNAIMEFNRLVNSEKSYVKEETKMITEDDMDNSREELDNDYEMQVMKDDDDACYFGSVEGAADDSELCADRGSRDDSLTRQEYEDTQRIDELELQNKRREEFSADWDDFWGQEVYAKLGRTAFLREIEHNLFVMLLEKYI
jgi:hypothetical protein